MPVEVTAELREALQHYSDLEGELVALWRQGDPSLRKELARWRRRMAEQTGRVGTLIEQDALLARTPAEHEEIGKIFGNFRHALWHHLARWPTVQIDEDLGAYERSAQGAYEEAELFWNWCTTHLALRR